MLGKMNKIKIVAIILILIGISIPVVSFILGSGYTQERDIITNIQQMKLISKQAEVPVFEKSLYDDAVIFHNQKFKYDPLSKTLHFVSKNDDNKNNGIEVEVVGKGLFIYFLDEISKSEIKHIMNKYYNSSVIAETIAENTKALIFRGYKIIDRGILPYRFLLASGILMVCVGVGILLIKNKSESASSA